jgi:hypothetical protein
MYFMESNMLPFSYLTEAVFLERLHFVTANYGAAQIQTPSVEPETIASREEGNLIPLIS